MKKTIALCLGLGLTLCSTQFVFAEDGGTYTTDGTVKFMPSTDPTNPVDPTNPDPDKPVNPVNPDGTDPTPGTKGPLSIDYASSFDFGMNKISNKTQTYYARAQKYKGDLVTPNYVQISDNRGSNAGWTLTLKQNGQFKNDDTLNKVLTGSVIVLTDPKVDSATMNVTAPTAQSTITLDPNGAESLVMTAAKNAGAGTWVDAFGTVETVTEKDADNNDVTADITKAIALTVPGNTPKDAVSYATTLTWTLTDVPTNEQGE